MVSVDEYFHDLMKKILVSYDVIKNLGDSKEDFFVLDVELTKINGLLRVLVRKSEEFSDKNIEFSKLQKKKRLKHAIKKQKKKDVRFLQGVKKLFGIQILFQALCIH